MTFSKVSLSIPTPVLKVAKARLKKLKKERGARYGLSTYVAEMLELTNKLNPQ